MATLKYLIKSAKRGKFATLWARLASGREYDIFAPTGYTLPPEVWSNERQSFKQRIAYTDEFTEEQARKMLNKLGDLKNATLTALNNKVGEPINKSWLLQIIELHHDSDAIRKKQLKHQEETLNTYIERFIVESGNGDRLSIKKLQYNPSTVKNLKSFQVQFNEYQRYKRCQYNFNNITIDFYDAIVQYFTVVKGYAPNTTGRMIKHLKILMRAARDEGYHNNTEIERRKFKVITENVDNIYLNESELRAMYELDLSDNKAHEVARDVFLIGCYTGKNG